MPDPERVAVFTIPSHHAFADSLVAGLIAQYGNDPLELARGRVLLPNNRAVRAVTDAFVRASGSGLLLPRLIPLGEPELEERVGGALDRASDRTAGPTAIEPGERLLRLAGLVGGSGAAERVRTAADLAKTLDALMVEGIDPARLRTAIEQGDELAGHWERSLEKLRLIYESWPLMLSEIGKVDLADRRNRLLHGLAVRWRTDPPEGFTVAAGITTAAPAIVALVSTIARMRGGVVVLAGVWLSEALPDEEWDALADGDQHRGDASHPQYQLRLLLDRLGIARAEVQRWRWTGGKSCSPQRTRAIANAMAAPEFSHKWGALGRAERRLSGTQLAELPDPASEAQAIALALREVLETPGKTAALITPDRQLAGRVSALLARWKIEADDSAGRSLALTAPGTLLLGIAGAASEQLAPVPTLALLKHPLVGGQGPDRSAWLQAVRRLDIKLRGPRPATGLQGLDQHFENVRDWQEVRRKLAHVHDLFGGEVSLARLAEKLGAIADVLSGGTAWQGHAGRMASELLTELSASPAANELIVAPVDCGPLLRLLLDGRSVRPPYGGHPRIFIWGLLEARLHRADLGTLGGLNEGVWPAASAPDPWLPPKIRATLGMPTTELRIGLAAHDFASALGAPEVLITRARRDSRSPTVASRFLLRLNALTGGLPRHRRLERWVGALDVPNLIEPAIRPAPRPAVELRPKRISVTQVDRLKADPFAFYAQAVLGIRKLEPVDADHTAAWKGTAVHKVFEQWLRFDECNPDKLRGRAEQLLKQDGVHPMLRALWGPRLLEAIDWVAATEREDQANGRRPLAAEADGEIEEHGVVLHGRADRIDRLPNDGLAIIDYKTGVPPTQKAVDAGFAMQLGLLGIIAGAGGFPSIHGNAVEFEYWSLARSNGKFGRRMCPAKNDAGKFLEHAASEFGVVVQRWLVGTEPFTAKLNPAYAPYSDYDQLMRLEEWYGR